MVYHTVTDRQTDGHSIAFMLYMLYAVAR